MNPPVLTRGSHRLWDLLLCMLLGLLFVGLGVWIASFPRRQGENEALVFAAVLGGTGVCVLLGCGAAWAWRVVRRQWVRDTGSGLIISDRGGEREVLDDRVLTLNLHFQNHYSGGLLKSFTRHLTLDVIDAEDRSDTLRLATTFKPGEADPLAGLIQRLSKRLLDEAEASLRQGGTVTGERWQWSEGELTFIEGKKEKSCRVEEITAIDVLEEQVRVWRRGQDEVFASVPQKTRNALLLNDLLLRELDKRPVSAGSPSDAGLGRIIFERSAKRYFAICLVLAIFLGGLGLLFLVISPLVAADRGVVILVGLGFLVAAGFTGLGAVNCRVASFRCHELGVYKRGLISERMLRYAQVRAFTYSAVRQFVHGAYAGTRLGLRFEPEEGGQAVNYSTTVQNADQALDTLRDHVAGIVGDKMARQVRAGGTVPWTPALSFHSSGLACKPSGWFGSRAEEIVGYHEVTGYNINEGYFYLWVRGEKKPRFNAATSTNNFFPGFYLLVSILQGTSPASLAVVEANDRGAKSRPK